ncbi:MAG: 30S ribosomal protein S9 [Candidatus Marinimicrobia bacterium]|jgi:small subunit ribosomal protein S9|nr:30S ribosomal protein S9 [Candidatus Neomarinimicrobiota bacterium]MCK9483590.1 30S ribosomal protein S9 [Candidatus Neomarinimicrobiota bacterium]MCK9560398.1 30S ribosomal protein S9 [Candidatus Neomarinimicrobiota bacterium]MDD5230257.1 30S ribosomal protein S9 [Candidatus Neomarinimicrobiota bacterium]MDD5540543.1 30S ribosomal protein S9 [Candidatus Neomarinimicrobiota bacterium]
MPKLEYISLGRRKCSVARLRMTAGEGKVTINSRTMDEYFGNESLKRMIIQPFEICGVSGQLDVNVNVQGGGFTGQAGAIRLAIARALEKYDPELRARLKPAGFLTRDARVKERKKYGLRGARRAFQFSKR